MSMEIDTEAGPIEEAVNMAERCTWSPRTRYSAFSWPTTSILIGPIAEVVEAIEESLEAGEPDYAGIINPLRVFMVAIGADT